MNIVGLTGRLTREPDIKYSNGGSTIARFTLAVNRRFKSEGGPDADFPNIIAFGKTAEFIEKYFHKGMKMDMTGRIQTGSYTKEDGTKVYTTDVVAESVEFGESKGGQQASQPKQDSDGFMKIPEDAGDNLPFV